MPRKPKDNKKRYGNCITKQVSKERQMALDSVKKRKEWEKGKTIRAVKDEDGIRLTRIIYT
jgi:hypothetical protein